MKNNSHSGAKAKGTWWHRFLIRLFTALFALLVFWALGFLVDDIRSVPGPELAKIEERHVDQDLVEKKEDLEKRIRELDREIENQRERQRVVGDSSQNLERTIHQLLELQKLSIEKDVSLSETEQANLAGSLELFLESQTRYQELSQTVAGMLERKQGLVLEKQQAEEEIGRQREPALEEYRVEMEKHRLTLAFWQLAVLLPILAVAAVLVVRKRGSIYFPLFLGFGIATLAKVTVVAHEYFPTRYFKYILIGALLAAVARVLIYFVRTIAYPKAEWLLKQYREAYEHFLCPVCEYPVRVGPRRFLFWTRRTVNKIVLPASGGNEEEKYTCPSCGTGIFEECGSCHGIRPALLPNCSHCGAEKEGGEF